MLELEQVESEVSSNIPELSSQLLSRSADTEGIYLFGSTLTERLRLLRVMGVWLDSK